MEYSCCRKASWLLMQLRLRSHRCVPMKDEGRAQLEPSTSRIQSRKSPAKFSNVQQLVGLAYQDKHP